MKRIDPRIETHSDVKSIWRISESGAACWAGGVLVLLAAGCVAPDAPPALAPVVNDNASSQPLDEHTSGIMAWREQRVAELTTETGWLTVVGLFWLDDGDNTFGSDPSNDLVLTAASAPARIGTILKTRAAIRMRVRPGVRVTHEGQPVTERTIYSQRERSAGVLELGSLSWFIIQRDGRHGLRVRDGQSEARRNFEGIEYFPIEKDWRVAARFERYDPPRRIAVPTVLGTTTYPDCPGAFVFEHDGRTHRLDAMQSGGENRLMIVFGDETNAGETYPGGRFLYVDLPAVGEAATLDFNRAENPPCAFTAFATCPLPPPQNRLPFAVTAGEKRYAGKAH